MVVCPSVKETFVQACVEVKQMLSSPKDRTNKCSLSHKLRRLFVELHWWDGSCVHHTPKNTWRMSRNIKRAQILRIVLCLMTIKLISTIVNSKIIDKTNYRHRATLESWQTARSQLMILNIYQNNTVFYYRNRTIIRVHRLIFRRNYHYSLLVICLSL
jgi:hypothetical protein